MEDEQAVRRLAADILTGAGYHVFAASRGAVALEIAAEETIDIQVADVVMPAMNGAEVAAAVRQLQPGVPVVFMSGYSEQPIPQVGSDPEIPPNGFVQKPFTRQAPVRHCRSPGSAAQIGIDARHIPASL